MSNDWMTISFSANVRPLKLKFEIFFNKYMKFNRDVILDQEVISTEIDNKPIDWAFASLMNKVWGGMSVDNANEYVSQVMRNSDCGGLVSTTFLLMNRRGDKLIIVLSGDITNVTPRDINICYRGYTDTYETYMNDLNIDDSDHCDLRKSAVLNQEKLCKPTMKLTR